MFLSITKSFLIYRKNNIFNIKWINYIYHIITYYKSIILLFILYGLYFVFIVSDKYKKTIINSYRYFIL